MKIVLNYVRKIVFLCLLVVLADANTAFFVHANGQTQSSSSNVSSLPSMSNYDEQSNKDEVLTYTDLNGSVLIYERTSQGCSITGYQSISNGSVSVPSKIQGSYVIAIEKDAFKECNDLTNITTESVTTIKEEAFISCTNLKTVSLLGTETIEKSAFQNCTSLNSIILATVEKIGDSAFVNCTSLQSMALAETTTLGKNTFEGCTSLSSFYGPKLISVPSMAFSNCIALTKATLSEELTIIEEQAFENCSSLKSIDLPNASQINAGAFANCKSMTEATIPNVTTIGDSAFYNCNNLQTPVMSKVSTIGSYGFANCEAITSLNYANLTKIGSYAFSQCINLSDIELAIVEQIDEGCFKGCINLKKVNLPKIEEVTSSLFQNNSALVAINLPNVNKIGAYAFSNCPALKVVKMNNVKLIDVYAFENCTKIESMDLSAVTYINNNAFMGDTSLSEVQLQKLEVLGSEVFKGCMNLTDLIIPATVVNIGETAFDPEIMLYTKEGSFAREYADSNGYTTGITRSIKYIDSGELTEEILYKEGAAAIIKASELQNESYTFIGYGLSQDSADISFKDGDTVVMDKDYSLYTIWGKPISNVSFDVNSLEVAKGETAQITATVTPGNVSYAKTTWTSSDNKIVQVDNYGKISGISGGTATVIAKAGDKVAECVVKVVEVVVPTQAIKIQLPSTSMMVGTQMMAEATFEPSKASDTDIRWISSDTSIAEISREGQITAWNTGIVKITALAGGKMAQQEIEIKRPITVNMFQASSQTQNIITLNWDNPKQIDGYVLYYYDPYNDKNIDITELPAETTSFTIDKDWLDNSLTVSTKYTFKISTYKNIRGKQILSDKVILNTATKPDAPVDLKINKNFLRTNASWGKVENIDGYELYISTEKMDEYRKVASTSKTNCNKWFLKNKSNYQFKVRAYIEIDGNYIYSDYSE